MPFVKLRKPTRFLFGIIVKIKIMKKIIGKPVENIFYYTSKMILLILFCSIQVKRLPAQINFQKGYGTTYDNRLVFAQQTADGNIIAAGNTFPGNKARICLVKTNINGDTIWTKTYGGTEHFYCNTLQQTNDNGFIFGGKVVDTIVGDSKILVIKTDAGGNIVWSKTYNSNMYDDIYSIKETSNGDYFMAGGGFVGRINANGNMIWSKNLNDLNLNIGLYIRSLDNTNDGDVILGGSIDTIDFINPKPYYAFLLKMSASGNVKWSKAIKSIYNIHDEGFAVIQGVDKGYVLTGRTHVPVGSNASINHIYLIKTDSLGNLSWSKKFGSSGNDNGSDIKQTADGGYIIAGSSSGFWGNGLQQYNAYLLKTSATGNVAWCKYYGSISQDEAASVSITNDGGYLASGITTGVFGHPDNLYLLKTDVSGNVNCSGFNWPLYDSTYISSEVTLNQSISPVNFTMATPLINIKHLVCNNYETCTVGLNEETREVFINIFPNPNNGLFTIDLTEIQPNSVIEIYSALGVLVKKQVVISGKSTLNLQNEANGLYFIYVISGEKAIKVSKIVKN